MLRRLAFVILFLIVTSASGQKRSSREEPEPPTTEVNPDPGKYQRGTEEAPLIVHEDDRPQSKSEAANDQIKREDKKHAEVLNIGLTGALVFVGFLQTIAIIFQVSLYKRQTRIMDEGLSATKDSALAARTSADALIASERAWITITPEVWNPEIQVFGPAAKTQMQKITLSVRNAGKTPAHVKEQAFRFIVISGLDELPMTPDYSSSPASTTTLLVPQDAFQEVVQLQGWENEAPATLISAMQRRTKFVFAFGFVRYEDNFGSSHETRAGYIVEFFHVPGSLSHVFASRQAGPADYNRAT